MILVARLISTHRLTPYTTHQSDPNGPMCRMIVGSVGIGSGTMPNRFRVVHLVMLSLHPWEQMGTTRDDYGCQDCQVHIHIPHTQHTKVLQNNNNLNWSIPAQFQPISKRYAVSRRINPCRDQLHTQYRPIVPRLKHPLNACADLRAPGCETATYARLRPNCEVFD